MFGGANYWREFCVSKLVGLDNDLKTHFGRSYFPSGFNYRNFTLTLLGTCTEFADFCLLSLRANNFFVK